MITLAELFVDWEAFHSRSMGQKIMFTYWPSYAPDRALSDVLRELKANTTGWMHEIFPELKHFSWQRGYGAFTVSHSNVEEVRHYIAHQKEHHAKISFRDEFIQFLIESGIDYDERYL